jgi:hypothetical protein
MTSGAMAPCPKDSAIMQTWETYKTSEEYKNSYSWATRFIPEDDPAELERIRAGGANPWTKQMKLQAVEGSLWAAFMHGWLEAGGTDPHKKLPTLEELEHLINSVDDIPIEIMPNGSNSASLTLSSQQGNCK